VPGRNGMLAPRSWRASLAGCVLSFLICAAACSDAPAADTASPAEPWFGLTAPPGLEPHTLQVLSERSAAPAVVPSGEGGYRHLTGTAIRADLETIVGFAVESRASREVGEGQIWGRITGFPSGTETVQWAVDQLRAAGIGDVRLQAFEQDEGASMWLPLSWEVRLLAQPSAGVGSEDVVFDSAMPISAGALPEGGLTAPLVFVGTASEAELAHIDVHGKIAIQKTMPQGHTVFVRSPVGPRSEDLLSRGALAVLRIIDLPGNVRVRDIGCGGGTCFNLGGRDGRFLESVMSEAAARGTLDDVRVRLRVESRTFSGLSAANGVAIIPGTSRADEYVVVNAHADSWFDGAGDNGDGLAILLALARHFAGHDIRLERSLAFVVSAGHHTPGLSGPRHFTDTNPEIVDRTVLVVNLEHTSQRHITPARSFHADGYREWTMDTREAPVVAGVTNLAPFLEGLVTQGIQRYGVNFVSGPNTMASGEGGTFRRLGLPVFTAMQGPPMYHTTGEVAEMISTPGLERMARFMAFFIEEVSRATVAEIAPG
jgi:hypothetical protein